VARNTIVLNNGAEIAALGLGVSRTAPDVTTSTVQKALRVGCRRIDTAAAYGGEREVGGDIRRSGLDRHEVFVETKLWISGYGAALHGHGPAGAIQTHPGRRTPSLRDGRHAPSWQNKWPSPSLTAPRSRGAGWPSSRASHPSLNLPISSRRSAR
jgi:hypothetical protein